jgi:hypothetical protein
MSFILLSAAQAQRVRYMERGKRGLNPIERADGAKWRQTALKTR